MEKKKIMLIVPMLHQGGFERVCVATARLLDSYYEIYIVMFDSRDIAYDIKGLNVIDLHLGVRESLAGKVASLEETLSRKEEQEQELVAAHEDTPFFQPGGQGAVLFQAYRRGNGGEVSLQESGNFI